MIFILKAPSPDSLTTETLVPGPSASSDTEKERGKERQTGRHISHLPLHSPVTAVARLGSAEAKIPELHLGLPWGW